MSSLVITLFPRPARERLPRLSSLRISRLRHQQHRCRLSQIPARVFFRVCGEYIRRVKYWQIMLVILATLSASIVLADDFKTIKGKEFKDATVSRVEPDGIVLKTKSGISKVYENCRRRFRNGFFPVLLRSPQHSARIELKSWASAMANRTSFVLFFVGGASLVAAAVFAIVRSRLQ